MANHAFAKDNRIHNVKGTMYKYVRTHIYIIYIYIYITYLIIIYGKIYTYYIYIYIIIYINIWEDHLNDVCSSVCHAGLPENCLIIRSIQNWDGPNIGNHFALN